MVLVEMKTVELRTSSMEICCLRQHSLAVGPLSQRHAVPQTSSIRPKSWRLRNIRLIVVDWSWGTSTAHWLIVLSVNGRMQKRLMVHDWLAENRQGGSIPIHLSSHEGVKLQFNCHQYLISVWASLPSLGAMQSFAPTRLSSGDTNKFSEWN